MCVCVCVKEFGVNELCVTKLCERVVCVCGV